MRAITLTTRIIPTRVGTSKRDSPQKSRRKDHPHACGDKSGQFICGRCVKGSSPRVWGQVDCKSHTCGRVWIIPTRVGTRRYVQPTPANPEDHPHACGDKIPVLVTVAFSLGSSPRVWGQVLPPAKLQRFFGIIPTRVGTSI